jgi:pimeloyl-ACP methyl ester carboxylesterase
MGCEAATRDDPVVRTAVAEAIERHRSAGREFEAAGIESVDAHIALLHRNDGGSTFRTIVRGFEHTEEKERFYMEGLREIEWPATILWADRDPALGEDRRRVFEDVLGIEAKVIPAKHFLQEDQAPAVADAIAGLATWA